MSPRELDVRTEFNGHLRQDIIHPLRVRQEASRLSEIEQRREALARKRLGLSDDIQLIKVPAVGYVEAPKLDAEVSEALPIPIAIGSRVLVASELEIQAVAE